MQTLLKTLISLYGKPKAIRSDNGSEFVASEFQQWMKNYGIDIATIDPESLGKMAVTRVSTAPSDQNA